MAVTLGNLAGQHRAGSAVGIRNRQIYPHRCAAIERRSRLRDQLAVNHAGKLVVLSLAIVDGDAGGRWRLGEQAREIKALRFPMVDQLTSVEHLRLADHLVEGAITHRCHQLTDFLGDKEKEIDDVLGLAAEALAQHRILGRHSDRTSVEMAFAHHDAASGDQRRRGESEFIGAK